MVEVNTRRVPKSVLEGRDKKYLRVHHLYKALIIREYYRLLHASLWYRGYGNNDPVAGKWKKLAKRTVKIKNSIAEAGYLNSYKLMRDWYRFADPETGVPNPESWSDATKFATRGSLSKLLLNPVLREILEDELKGKTSPEAKTAAMKKAWQRIHDAEPDRQFATVINYRTGRLFGSAYPGIVSNHRYYPSSKDQIVKYVRKKVVISFDAIEYANEVDAKRPLMPSDPSTWLLTAHENIIGEVEAYYESLRSSYKERAIEAKRKDSRKRVARLKARGSRRSPRRKTANNRRSTNTRNIPF